ncbi:MAG: carboxypeptidase regulatory-like domain-containing protein [Vicinamibacterales bacterium]
MRSMTLTALTAAMLMTGLFVTHSPGVQAQGGAALTGSVTSQEEGKMEGVVVSARKDGTTFTVSVVSNDKGAFTFPRTHLQPGAYTLKIRAVGYDLASGGTADVPAGKTGTANLTLTTSKDLASQLTSLEWANSMNGTPEQKERFNHQLMSCGYCHTYQRILKSKHDPEALLKAMTRMMNYYSDGTAVSNDNRRGRAARIQEHGREGFVDVPEWGFAPGLPRKELAVYVSENNLSNGRTTWPFELKALPRPKGKGTQVIITEWDMPTASTVSHDSDMDSKGILWYTDQSRQVLGKFDPKSGVATEIPMPPVPKGDLEGGQDLVVDKDDKVWFPMRIPGGRALLTKYDPATGQFTSIPEVASQFVALGGDGSVWAGNTRVDPKTMLVTGRFSYQKDPAVPAGSGGYHNVVDSKGNPWVATYRGPGGVIGIDAKTNKVTWISAPGLKARRGRVDAQDRYWFGEYLGDKVSMVDLKTGKVQRWDVRPWSEPYTASTPDSKGRVYYPSNMSERMIQLDPKTGEIVEFQWPAELDVKKLSIDPTTTTPIIWGTNKRTARVMKIEPLN